MQPPLCLAAGLDVSCRFSMAAGSGAQQPEQHGHVRARVRFTVPSPAAARQAAVTRGVVVVVTVSVVAALVIGVGAVGAAPVIGDGGRRRWFRAGPGRSWPG